VSVICGLALAVVAGCETAPLTEQVIALREENRNLQSRLEQADDQNQQLQQQLQVLGTLPPDIRLENLYNVQKIKVTRYTNLYDVDEDGHYEKLVVYIQPIDEEGDIVKASGTVDVQLWNLDKKNGDALLNQWHVEPQELKKSWFATLLTINYRLAFDVADKVTGDEKALTVKVTFTDYLTGKVLQEQRTFKPLHPKAL
jgi:hypothetical protein